MASVRTVVRALHRWPSFVVGFVALAVGLSGSILTFREEIEHALYEPRIEPGSRTATLAEALAKAGAVDPLRRVSVIVLPDRPERPLQFILQKRGALSLKEADQWTVYASPYDGKVLSWRSRETSGIARLRDLHFALFGGVTGLVVNGWMALVLALIALSGVVLWFQTATRGRRFRITRTGSWKRTVWDLHRVGGIVFALLLATAALSGAYYSFRETFTRLLASATGPLAPRATPTVEGPAGASALDADAIAGAARAVMPDLRLAVLRPPSQPNQAWAATFHRPGDQGESTDSGPTAFLNPYTGAVLRLDDRRTMSPGGRILKTMEPLHYGKLFGLPGRLVWFFVGLTPGLLFVSGLLMWWNRTRGLRPRRAAAPILALALPVAGQTASGGSARAASLVRPDGT